MANVLMRMFDAEFGHPRATAGRIGGAITVRANAEH